MTAVAFPPEGASFLTRNNVIARLSTEPGPEMLAWRSGQHVSVARDTLLLAAYNKLRDLARRQYTADDETHVEPLAVLGALGLLDRLVQDNSPTPQVFPYDDGLEIVWLVGGDWAQAIVRGDGSVTVSAGWADGRDEVEPLDFDIRHPDDLALGRMLVFIGKLSDRVNYRA